MSTWKLGDFDTKTSNWVKAPLAIRNLGGALFCDRRFDTVFLYQNGSFSYSPPDVPTPLKSEI